MKIHFDKISKGYAGHSMNARELKELLVIIPKEWTESFNKVHFSNQYPENSQFGRPVVLSEVCKRLMICSRGLSSEKTAEHILIELAQRKHTKAHFGNTLDCRQLKTIKEIIMPYMDIYKNKS